MSSNMNTKPFDEQSNDGGGSSSRPATVTGTATSNSIPNKGQQQQVPMTTPPPPPRNPTRSIPSGARPPDTGNAQRMHQPHGVPALGPTNNFPQNQQLLQQQQMQHQQQQMQQQLPYLPQTQGYSEASPLPPMVQRSLGDRSNEKRKNAALEIEALIKSLGEANNFTTVNAVIAVLSKDFCTSMNSNYRKGGLVGLAATAIGLQSATSTFLHILLPPVLHCFDDPESRVRYYACESLYNMAKVSRQAILSYFNPIFEGLTKLYADVDVDVKNGANLLDRLIKDIVTEADSDTFQIDQFLPVMQNYIRRTNPYIRQLIVGWITLLDSMPDISMLDYLPDFLDGLFNMLSDSNREIRQAADSALSDFLRELSVSQVLEFGPIISILVYQCQSKERLNRLTAITWLAELTHHPLSGGDALLPFLPEILSAILFCISDHEKEIRLVAERTNNDLLQFVHETTYNFKLQLILETLIKELLDKDDISTKMAALKWINMLMEKRMHDMHVFTVHLLPVLLRTLSDPSDAVVLLDLQVLSRISLAVTNNNNNTTNNSTTTTRDGTTNHNNNDGDSVVVDDLLDKQNTSDVSNLSEREEAQFQLVLNAILNLFAQDRQLLETRGSLIIRKLCVLLNAKAVYIRMAETLSSFEFTVSNEKEEQASTLHFISTMVQTLNLILLTASELHDLRSILANSFVIDDDYEDNNNNVITGHNRQQQHNNNNHKRNLSSSTIDSDDEEDGNVFATLFHCWCHNPVATFSLCLLAKAYDLSFALVKRFSDMEDISVGFLMQIDKLVHLLESPIFVHMRLQLLNVEAPYHAQLLKSIYGVLMCLPQGESFRLLNDRLTTVCNLRDNLGYDNGRSGVPALNWTDPPSETHPIVSKRGLDMEKLLDRFDTVMERHREVKASSQQKLSVMTVGSMMSDIPHSGPPMSTSNSYHHSIQQSISHPSGFGHRLTPTTTNVANNGDRTFNNNNNNTMTTDRSQMIHQPQTSPTELLR